jgi:proteic killer suppression protein
MEITYANSKIQKICTNDKIAQKVLGKNCASILRVRLKDMQKAESLEKLRFAPGHYHELIGDRKGQLACNLLGRTRLIFSSAEPPHPKKDDGGLDWSKITKIEHIEIIDYH